MKKINTGSSCLLMASALLMMSTAATAASYKTMKFTNGGTISGQISFKGALPKNQILEISSDKETCGSSITTDYYLGSGGGLKNVVVAIEKIDKGKAYDKKGIIPFDNKKCMFVPHVVTAVKGQKLGINNSDPILHNTHLYHGRKQRTVYNIALPLQNKVIKKKMKKAGVVTVKCDAHDWMVGYVYVTKHPYATVTAMNGSFEISNVPPGTYKIKIWHPKLGEVSKEVTVPAKGVAKLTHVFSK